MREYDAEASAMCSRVTEAQWAYVTNITDINKRRMVRLQERISITEIHIRVNMSGERMGLCLLSPISVPSYVKYMSQCKE